MDLFPSSVTTSLSFTEKFFGHGYSGIYLFLRYFITCYLVCFCAECVADIVFLLDNSASIRHNERRGANNWQLILDFVKSIIDAFVIGPQDTRVAVIDFGL